MAKVFSFPKMSASAADSNLATYLDQGDLLEFSSTQENISPEPNPVSIYATDWTNQELADLYRAHTLIQAAQPGLDCDRGISDEGDPWFMIGDRCGDVFIHICRVNGEYLLDSVSLSQVLRGPDFASLVDDFVRSVVGSDREKSGPANVIHLHRGGVVFLHPSMLLAALIWTLLQDADELGLPFLSESEGSEGAEQLGVSEDTVSEAALSVVEAVSQTEFSDVASDLELSVSVEPSGFEHKDDKQFHVSTFAHGLTAVAIAASLYSSAKAMNVLWGLSGEADTQSVPSDMADGNSAETQANVNVTLALVPDVLEMLGSLVEIDLFELVGEYAEAFDSSGDPQMALREKAMLKNLLLEDGENNLPLQAERGLAAKEAIGFDHDHNSEIAVTPEPVRQAAEPSDAQDATIKTIMDTLVAGNWDLIQMDATSLLNSMDIWEGSLQALFGESAGGAEAAEYKEFLAVVSSHTPQKVSLESLDSHGNVLFSPRPFDDSARSFLDDKLQSADFEILAFEREIIFVDKAAFSGNTSSVTWQLEDGGRISIIGLSSDLSEFFLA